MPAIRLTAYFRDDDGHGWSEQHDVDGGSGVINLSSFLTTFDGIMKTARRPMLAGDAYYIGCRASYRTGNGTIAASNLLADVPLKGTQTLAGESLWTDAPEVAIKLRVQNAASTANSDIYVRGAWDGCVIAGVLNFVDPVGAAWKALAVTYFNALKSANYGWSGINPATTSRGTVVSYIVNPAGHVEFSVLPTNGVVLPAVNTKLNVNFARINNSNSILNRSLLVTVKDANTFVTVRPVSAGDFVSMGTYIAPVKSLIIYDHIGYFKLAQRKTGRPFGVGRGRLSARPLN